MLLGYKLQQTKKTTSPPKLKTLQQLIDVMPSAIIFGRENSNLKGKRLLALLQSATISPLRPYYPSPAMTTYNLRSTTPKRRKTTALTARTITNPISSVSATAPTCGEGTSSRKLNKPLSISNPVVGDIEDVLRFNKDDIFEIRASLLEWYDSNRRDLPWRRLTSKKGKNHMEGKRGCRGKYCEGDDEDEDRKAYGVWVSEVMLQQTRVVTVIDYYNRWMEKWPSIHHLSLAALEEVNEMWAGLGYYRRARYLLEGAKMITEDGGRFPRTVSALKKVPGIGKYTAGAIASIAFNEAVPLVDGNVVRVLARLKAISANPKYSTTVNNFWKLAEQLVDPHRPGDFNQGLMELGATVCTSLSPTCSACPISRQCHALTLSQTCASSLVTDYPQKVVKAKQRHETSAVCVVEVSESEGIAEETCSKSWYLLVKRPDEGLLAGLWEFPSVMLGLEADMEMRKEAIDQFLAENCNLDLKQNYIFLRDYVGEYVHIFSHIRLKMHIELLILHLQGGMNLLQSLPDKGAVVWKYVDGEELSNMGLTSGVRKVYTMVQRFKENSVTSDSVPTKLRRKCRFVSK